MSIGERIRSLRRERNWTQEELGKKVGVLGRNLARYENGHTAPRKRMLERFAQAFDVTVAELEMATPPAREAFLEDGELTNLFREIYSLSEEDRVAVKRVLSLVVKQNQIQRVIAS